MSIQSEQFHNQQQSYIDTDSLETAKCVLMYRVNQHTGKFEREWVPLAEAYTRKYEECDGGNWDCYFSIPQEKREEMFGHK